MLLCKKTKWKVDVLPPLFNNPTKKMKRDRIIIRLYTDQWSELWSSLIPDECGSMMHVQGKWASTPGWRFVFPNHEEVTAEELFYYWQFMNGYFELTRKTIAAKHIHPILSRKKDSFGKQMGTIVAPTPFMADAILEGPLWYLHRYVHWESDLPREDVFVGHTNA
jgi:hypothetical protein